MRRRQQRKLFYFTAQLGDFAALVEKREKENKEMARA
jgi:hypothetical protein